MLRKRQSGNAVEPRCCRVAKPLSENTVKRNQKSNKNPKSRSIRVLGDL